MGRRPEFLIGQNANPFHSKTPTSKRPVILNEAYFSGVEGPASSFLARRLRFSSVLATILRNGYDNNHPHRSGHLGSACPSHLCDSLLEDFQQGRFLRLVVAPHVSAFS